MPESHDDSTDGLKFLGLSYGVMVALQFLVLSVQVRILVRQQSKPKKRGVKETKSHSLPLLFISSFRGEANPFLGRIPHSNDWHLRLPFRGWGAHSPPPIRSQKKIPLPQIRNQNPILPRIRNPPINPSPAVTPHPDSHIQHHKNHPSDSHPPAETRHPHTPKHIRQHPSP